MGNKSFDVAENVQCKSCGHFGPTRKQGEISWRCSNEECGQLGGILIEPIKFVYRIPKMDKLR